MLNSNQKSGCSIVIAIIIVLFLIRICIDFFDDIDSKLRHEQRLFEKCQKSCGQNNFEEAHEYLNELYAYYKSHCGSWHNDNERLLEIYSSAEDYVFTSESQYLISHIDEKNSADRICYLLTSLPVRGTYFPNGTVLDKRTEYDGRSDDYIDYSSHRLWVQKYNQKCDKLLTLAIGIDNKKLAKRILALYKNDCIIEETIIEKGDDEEHDTKQYVAMDSQDSKRAAIKQYNEAFK